jgi:hypothetical protein
LSSTRSKSGCLHFDAVTGGADDASGDFEGKLPLVEQSVGGGFAPEDEATILNTRFSAAKFIEEWSYGTGSEADASGQGGRKAEGKDPTWMGRKHLTLEAYATGLVIHPGYRAVQIEAALIVCHLAWVGKLEAHISEISQTTAIPEVLLDANVVSEEGLVGELQPLFGNAAKYIYSEMTIAKRKRILLPSIQGQRGRLAVAKHPGR